MILVIGGAVVGSLYAFGILPPGSDSGVSVTRRGPLPTRTPNSTTAVATPQPSPALEQAAEQPPPTAPATTTPEGTQQAQPSIATTPPTAVVEPLAMSPAAAAAPGAPTATAEPTLAPTLAPSFDGIYTLTVSQPLEESFAGKAISFKIGNFTANEGATWQQGQTVELDLTASSSSLVPIPSGDEPIRGDLQSWAGTPLAAPLRQPAPPSVFQGTASVDGSLVPEGTIVTAWVDGIEVGTASVVARPAVPSSLSRAGEYFSPLSASLKRVWSYDTPIQFWYFYDPRAAFAATSTLSEVLSGGIV